MDVSEAIARAKDYVRRLYEGEGETISGLDLEEVEHDAKGARWRVTLAFSRPLNGPRTRAEETLASIGALTGRRALKVVTLSDTGDGRVVSMKNPVLTD